MKRITTLLTVIIISVILLCGCQGGDVPTICNPEWEFVLAFNSYEEFAQSIKDGWFFDQNSSLFKQQKDKVFCQGFKPDDELETVAKEKMAVTSIIKPLVNGEELDWYADANSDYRDTYLRVYYPYENSSNQAKDKGYTAYHLFQDSRLMFLVEYSFDVTSNEDFPENEKANYDAVINGQNVCIEYSQDSTGRCFGVFQYKDMYEVNIVTENKKQFDIVFSNLTIEEIRVK